MHGQDEMSRQKELHWFLFHFCLFLFLTLFKLLKSFTKITDGVTLYRLSSKCPRLYFYFDFKKDYIVGSK